MTEETPKTRKRQVVQHLSNDDRKSPIERICAAAQAGERLWDKQPTALLLVRAVMVPGNGMSGTQGISQVWLRPKSQQPTPTDRSTGYVLSHDAIGLDIQLEERDHLAGTCRPSVLVFVPWANVAGITSR